MLEHLDQQNVGFELGSTEAIKRLVAAGAGLGCLSRHAVAQALQAGWLVELRTRLPHAVRRLAMVMHRDKTLGWSTEAFIGYCLAAYPQSPAGARMWG